MRAAQSRVVARDRRARRRVAARSRRVDRDAGAATAGPRVHDVEIAGGIARDTPGPAQPRVAPGDRRARGRVAARPGRVHGNAAAVIVGDVEVARRVECECPAGVQSGVAAGDRIDRRRVAARRRRVDRDVVVGRGVGDVDAARGVEGDADRIAQVRVAAPDRGRRRRVPAGAWGVDRHGADAIIRDVDVARGVQRDAPRAIETGVAAAVNHGRRRGVSARPGRVGRDAVGAAVDDVERFAARRHRRPLTRGTGERDDEERGEPEPTLRLVMELGRVHGGVLRSCDRADRAAGGRVCARRSPGGGGESALRHTIYTSEHSRASSRQRAFRRARSPARSWRDSRSTAER